MTDPKQEHNPSPNENPKQKKKKCVVGLFEL